MMWFFQGVHYTPYKKLGYDIVIIIIIIIIKKILPSGEQELGVEKSDEAIGIEIDNWVEEKELRLELELDFL